MGVVFAWFGGMLLAIWAVQALVIAWLYRNSLREYERPMKLKKQIP